MKFPAPKVTLFVSISMITNTVFSRGPHFHHNHVKMTEYWYFGLLIPVLLIWFAVYSARKK